MLVKRQKVPTLCEFRQEPNAHVFGQPRWKEQIDNDQYNLYMKEFHVCLQPPTATEGDINLKEIILVS